MNEGEEINNKIIRIQRPTQRLCGRCAFARMSGNKLLNPKRKVDMCHFGRSNPVRIVSLKRCPKKLHDVFNTFNTVEDRKKGNFEG